jgi:hypothetical protein
MDALMDKNDETVALHLSIIHWEKMLDYAKAQIPTEFVSASQMLDDIGETWSGIYCALCQRDVNTNHRLPCPLIDCVCKGDCHCFWFAIAYSSTWGEWIQNAEKLIKLLKDLHEIRTKNPA